MENLYIGWRERRRWSFNDYQDCVWHFILGHKGIYVPYQDGRGGIEFNTFCATDVARWAGKKRATELLTSAIEYMVEYGFLEIDNIHDDNVCGRRITRYYINLDALPQTTYFGDIPF